jgi:hypothetical protein
MKTGLAHTLEVTLIETAPSSRDKGGRASVQFDYKAIEFRGIFDNGKDRTDTLLKILAQAAAWARHSESNQSGRGE